VAAPVRITVLHVVVVLLLAFLLPLVLFVPLGAIAGPAPQPVIDLESLPNGVYSLKASIMIAAPLQAVWEVVNDYDHLADFMPHFEMSRVTSWGDSVIVRQRGGSSFIITKHVDLTLSFHPFPPDSATFHMLAGSIDRYAGVWRFEGFSAGETDSTRLVYEVEMGCFHIPGVILRHVIRRDVGEMMPAIAREVARRGAAPGGAPRRR